MTPAAGYAVSSALGAALGLAMVAASAAAAKVVERMAGPRRYRAGFAWGPGLRMAAALAGVVIGVALRPPSVAAFVMVFLAAYLAGQSVVVLRARA